MQSALVFGQPNGKASQTIHIVKSAAARPRSDEVSVEWLAAPINPIDLIVVAGKYPTKPKYSINGEFVAGFDGVARVLTCGDEVESLKPGDLVVPNTLGLGTWRTRAVLKAEDLLAIPMITDVTMAALLKSAILPAYFLVEDMRTLKPGDWIIQNAGTGVISQLVVQIAHLRGVKVISVVRDREMIDSPALQDADIVLCESDLPAIDTLKGKRILLGLDSVFGTSAAKLAGCISNHGTLVNYGQLGGGGPSASMALSHRLLFFDRLTFRSFRGTEQIAARSKEELGDLCAWLAQMIERDMLRHPEIDVLAWNSDEEEFKCRVCGALDRAQDGTAIGTRKTVIQYPG
ncbi:MAG: putative secondary metabolism biosynthetic enzyme [Candelaria pacifica]|nr:MAG: putative secondary metabolism biosynthetic enzyme [Candelaria pacifica]